MKKTVLAVLVLALFVVCGCGGGGGGLFDPEDELNIFGFRCDSLTPANVPTMISRDIRALAAKPSSDEIYAATGNGLYSFDSLAVTPVFTRIDDGLTLTQPLNCLFFESANDLLVGADNGLFRVAVQTGAVSAIAEFAGKKVLSIAMRSVGTFWVGMEDLTASTTSIARVDNGIVAWYGSDKSMTASSVTMIYLDPSSTMVMACGTGDTGRGGLFRFNPGSDNFRQEIAAPLAGGATYFTKIGTIWYACGPDAGLAYSSDSGNEWKQATLNTASLNSMGYIYLPTWEMSRYWFTAQNGVYYSYDLETFKLLTETQSLANNNSGALLVAENFVWIGHPGAATGGITRIVFTGE